MADLVSWLEAASFNYDEVDDERLGLIAESEVRRKCKEAANEIRLLRGLLSEVISPLGFNLELIGRIRGVVGNDR